MYSLLKCICVLCTPVKVQTYSLQLTVAKGANASVILVDMVLVCIQ